MIYSEINNDDVVFFKKLIGENHVFLDQESIFDYSHDETEDLKFPPSIVLKPCNTDQVASIINYCNLKKIPVTPCGARTGLSGGSLPIVGGVALSLELLNRIIEVDEMKLVGVLVTHYHPDHIGGNIFGMNILGFHPCDKILPNIFHFHL